MAKILGLIPAASLFAAVAYIVLENLETATAALDGIMQAFGS